MRRIGTVLLPFALAVLASPRPAAAKLVEGDSLPAITAKGCINAEGLEFDSLHGRVVLCEVFSPG